ncbi:response regulator transcription factor [Microvirga sp. Mcv34]|uniref:response regulator transcription factor n=1 Tax=Microvirga sp. Mcv34 TaxID=2926016 RepID=UPI0021C920AD|nr:response regulator [Microvirga sp. Mcv34]
MTGELLIAIVDDDDSAREAAVDLVRALGFAAVGFSSGTALLNSEDLRTMDCLIADVRMPDMGGFELHLALAGSDARIPTILMTAYPDERIRKRALAAGVRCFIEKPLEADHLLACIRSAVAGPGASEHRGPPGS